MAQEAVDGGLQAREDPPEPKTDNCCLIEPQPIREEQVQNALKFLSHPKVNGSPIEQRRSFLEKKGLSREEIDEAFRLLPDPQSNESANTTVFPEGRYNVPLQSQIQSGGFSQEALTAYQQPTAQLVGPVTSSLLHTHTGSHWSQLVLGVGFLVATGAAAVVLFQRVFVPKLKTWIQGVISEENAEQGKQIKLTPIEEAASAAAAAANAATAAAEVANKNREMFKSCTEEMHRLTGILKSLEKQTQELKRTFPRRVSLSQDPKQMVSKSNGCLPAVTDCNKDPSFRRGTMPLVQLQVRHGIQSYPEPEAKGQVQISNIVAKTETSNASQTTPLTARSTSEDCNKRYKSMLENELGNVMPPGQCAEISVQITEADVVSDGDSHCSKGDDSSDIGDLNKLDHKGCASPPSPRTMISGADFANTHQKTVRNGDSKSLLVSAEKDLSSRPAATSIEDATSTSTSKE